MKSITAQDSIVAIAALLRGREAYIVGGWLRDELLGRPTQDLDIAVPENPQKLAAAIAGVLKGKCITLDKERQIYRVILFDAPIRYIDVALYKGKTIDDDLALRDFTVNAMARPVNGTRIIDPLGGRKDLKKRVIRACGATAFTDDPLRMLRAFRFAAELDFTIVPATRALIKKYADRIAAPAGERIREELFRLLARPGAAKHIHAMETTGLMKALFPEFLTMKRHTKKCYYHPGGLWQHAMETLEAVEEVMAEPQKFLPISHEKAVGHLSSGFNSGITRGALLKLAALFHDMAKPACAKKVEGRMRFLGHDKVGADMFEALLRRLKVGKAEIQAGRMLVEHHMRPITLGQAPQVTQRAMLRLFEIVKDVTPELMLLSLADCLSYRSIKKKIPAAVPLCKQTVIVDNVIGRFFENKSKPAVPRLIDGTMIMKTFNLPSGKKIGELLRLVAQAQQSGKISTPEQALALIKLKL